MASKRKLTFFFWAFLFLAILLQLATNQRVSFSLALLHTFSILATCRLYFRYASRPATQRFVARQSTLALALQGYLPSRWRLEIPPVTWNGPVIRSAG